MKKREWAIAVKKALIEKGIAQTDLSRVTGYQYHYQAKVINGQYKSRKCEKAISEYLGIELPEEESDENQDQ